MTSIETLANDLRSLANRLELVEQDLPVPDTCAVIVTMPEAADVLQAGEAFDTPAFASMGAVTTGGYVGSVELRFEHQS